MIELPHIETSDPDQTLSACRSLLALVEHVAGEQKRGQPEADACLSCTGRHLAGHRARRRPGPQHPPARPAPPDAGLMALQRSPSTVPPGPLSLGGHQGAWATPRSTTPNGAETPARGSRFPASGSCSPETAGEFSTGRRARAASKYAALADAGLTRCRRGCRPHGPRRARKTTPGDPRNAAKPRRYWLVPENPPAPQAA